MTTVLHIMPLLPWPPTTGGELRGWHLCKELNRHARQTVLCRTLKPVQAPATHAFAALGIQLTAVHVPRPSPALKCIKAAQFLFSRYPVRAAGWHHSAVRKQLRNLLSREQYDLIVLHTSMLCSMAPLLVNASAVKVLDLYDVESVALRSKASVHPPGLRRAVLTHDAARMRRAERRLLSDMDLVLVTSETDRERLTHLSDATRTVVVPNGIQIVASQTHAAGDGKELLFVGSLHYHPNVDAVLFFATTVWPELRRRFPQLGFNVVGRSPPPQIQALDGTNGICVTGEVESVDPWYQRASVAVVPLRAGGGTRLKVTEALAHSCPVVSTSVGCEGLELQHGMHLLIADTPSDFAARVTSLLTDTTAADQLAQEGRRFVEGHYTWQRIADDLWVTLSELLNDTRREFSKRSGGH